MATTCSFCGSNTFGPYAGGLGVPSVPIGYVAQQCSTCRAIAIVSVVNPQPPHAGGQVGTNPRMIEPDFGFDDEICYITLPSGDARIDYAEGTKPDHYAGSLYYGAGLNGERCIRRLAVRESEFRKAAERYLSEHGALGVAPTASALDQAYAQGVAAALAAASDAKYDAEKYGQPWSVGAVKVRRRE